MAEPHSGKKPWIKTPLVHSIALSRLAGCQIYLKLELHQPSGSFKSRGIGNLLLTSLAESQSTSTSEAQPAQTHFYSSSGGNAGLACVHAALTLSSAATIVVPLSTSAYMIAKLRVAGATDIIQYGASWVEADTYLRETVIVEARKRGERAVYVSPFDDPAIWAGHATLVDEIVEDLGGGSGEAGAGMESVKAVVCSVGGGGLFCGVVQGLQKHKLEQQVKVVALETEGADSLFQSVHAGEHVTLDKITSIATSLGARKVADKTYEYATRDGNNVICERLSDREAIMGCLELAEWERVLVEPACGINVAVCMNGRLGKLIPDIKQEDKVVVVVCGGSNVNIDMMAKWKSEYMTASA